MAAIYPLTLPSDSSLENGEFLNSYVPDTRTHRKKTKISLTKCVILLIDDPVFTIARLAFHSMKKGRNLEKKLRSQRICILK